MTDAELNALAALVHASCTHIEAENELRRLQGAPPYYGEYVDLYGDAAVKRIEEELARRQGLREDQQQPCAQCGGPRGKLYQTCSRCRKSFCGICAHGHAEKCGRSTG